MTSSPRTDADADVHRRIRQQEVVAELGQQALETDDLDRLMRDAAAAVAETLDNDYAKVLELLSGDETVLRQGVGWHEDLVGNATVPSDTASQAGQTLRSEQPIIVDDLRTEDRFSGSELLTSHDIVSGISVIIGSVETPWGVLGTHTSEHREFTEHDATFVKSVANVLASAIESKGRERELSRFRRAVEASGHAIYMTDVDGEITYVNTAFEETTGYAAEEVIGETPSILQSGEHDDSYYRTLWETIRSGDVWEEEITDRRKDGEVYCAEQTIAPVTDEEGTIDRFVAVQNDITERKKRERALEESEARFRMLAENLEEMVWISDPTTREILYINPAYERIFGRDCESLLDDPRTFLEAVHPDDRTRIERAYDAVPDESFDEVYRIVRPDGRIRWLNTRAAPVRDDERNIRRIVGIAEDITERKERERALEESEQRYRALVEHFPNGAVALVDEDLCYRTVGGNPEDVADVTAEEVRGKSIDRVLPPRLAEELAPRYEAALHGESGTFEIELDDRFYQFQIVPVRDEDGGIFAALGMSQDITERTKAQRKLEESERRYRTLVKNFPKGAVALFDEDLSYTAAGGELMDETGVSPEDRIGTTVYDIYPDEIVDEVESYFHAALDGDANSFEVAYHDRNLFAHTLPVRDAADEIYAGMLVVQDVTTRREYQRKLEESNERLEQFAYAASHDLQEPLRMVSSYLSLIESRYGDELDENAEEFLEFAVDGAERMREMIDGLLAYSRVDTQGDPLEPVDLNRLVEDVQEDLRMRIDESDARVVVEELPRVNGDNSQLRQVFQNLLSNAITYSGDEPPQIRVEAERRGRKWRLSVRDEGIGIDPDDQERVFEVFQRLHGREEHPGTGIGLALCQRIVERHGGTIWVESEPDEGATFSFTLPAASE